MNKKNSLPQILKEVINDFKEYCSSSEEPYYVDVKKMSPREKIDSYLTYNAYNINDDINEIYDQFESLGLVEKNEDKHNAVERVIKETILDYVLNNKHYDLNLINNVRLKKYIECQAINDAIDNIEQNVENIPLNWNWENNLRNLSDWKEFKGTAVEKIEKLGLPKIAEVEIEKWYQNKFKEIKNLELDQLKDIYEKTQFKKNVVLNDRENDEDFEFDW